MGTVALPERREVDHSSGGSQTSTVSTKESDNAVSSDVVRKEVVAVEAENQTSSQIDVTLEETDTSNTIQRDYTFKLDADAGQTIGEESDRTIFEVRRGNRFRVTTGDNATVWLELRDVRA